MEIVRIIVDYWTDGLYAVYFETKTGEMLLTDAYESVWTAVEEARALALKLGLPCKISPTTIDMLYA